MSVIVMGMEMPERCETCDLICDDDSGLDVCCCTGEIVDREEQARPRWCPLRPLPEKHGGLIDVDVLKKTFRDVMDDCEGDFKRKEDAEEVRRWVELLCRDFDAQPTIVEAEGE